MESKTVKTQYRKENLLWLAHNMKLPTRIQALTLKLGLKARRESKFRFYSLYHHIGAKEATGSGKDNLLTCI
jgi:hypothetical protein